MLINGSLGLNSTSLVYLLFWELDLSVSNRHIPETCVASISLEELQALSSKPNGPPPIDRSRKLTYGAIRGSNALREAIAAMYSTNMQVPLAAENILIMPGGIAANFLALYTLCGPGDHVICVYPTYQQLYELPKAAGAEVSLWRLKESNANVPDLADLESLLKPNTKMIIIKSSPRSLLSYPPTDILQQPQQPHRLNSPRILPRPDRLPSPQPQHPPLRRRSL
jgi:hypothetical protein